MKGCQHFRLAGLIDRAFGFELPAPGKYFTRPEQRLTQSLFMRTFPKSGIFPSEFVNLRFCFVEIATQSRATFSLPALFLSRIDLARARLIVDDPAMHPPCGFQPHTDLLGLLDHRNAEIVIIEVMIPLQVKELAFLRLAVQHHMGVRMLPVLMHRNNPIEVPSVLFVTEKPLTELRRDVAY